MEINASLLNKLHLKMIELDSGDSKRIQHFCKVHSYSKLIAECEEIDSHKQFILEAAALTHDIGIHYCEEKYGKCSGKLQEQEGPAIADKMLHELGFPEDVIERVKFLIGHHHTYSKVDDIDYQILIEADFLVNCYEDEVPLEAAKCFNQNVFRTNTGKKILKDMYLL